MCNGLTSLCIKLSRLELYGTKGEMFLHIRQTRTIIRQTRTIERRTHRKLMEMGDHYGAVCGLTYDYVNTRIPTRF